MMYGHNMMWDMHAGTSTYLNTLMGQFVSKYNICFQPPNAYEVKML